MKYLILLLALIFTACSKRDSVAEFKQYHPDAANETAYHCPDFVSFDTVTFSSVHNGLFEVDIIYTTTKKERHEAIGLFKHTGKFISIEYVR
jgi:hypothetical protein